MNAYRQRPSWVDEEPLVQEILNRFLDQCDRSVKAQLRVSAKSTPELFDYVDDDPQYLWHLLKSLDNEYHILSVQKQRGKSGRDANENALLVFNSDQEALVRAWLNRPAFDPYTLTWNERFAKVHHVFEDNGAALEKPLRVEGRSAGEVLQAFASLAEQIATPQTLRNLSAKCFWGDSKFLDNKFDLVCALFPQASMAIEPRPIMMNVVLPDQLDEIIFVENQDSFLMLKQLADLNPRFMHSAFVYSSGFKGSSLTVRKKGNAIFSTLNSASPEMLIEFQRWWFDGGEAPCYFWGDMDYAGLAILRALRKSFEGMQAWQPGYELMMSFHDKGHGHQIRDSKKMKQLDPGTCGCRYADDVLLPAIRSSQRFLDQEIVALREFEQSLI
ncbi:Wadjet anti-phage system protein JetD domain-containing protein [Agaribacterium haliotis]|uniref:Wadjet anti-phage system protein JetD domain-containing protein n=1 Tax=Agaribacterium haliotis TaxID=2013869 RepID=UPI000BB566E9|nr:Wadjet anti-phage system protein JetD domain-containing protein [Agaribacterium haliotis]